ncbi:MAG: hypothetical protein MUW56_09980 [Chryseobacterium sp.]|uniref:hypothetical protein n=1 Tax=Chryseobacterium sp. TaxID=1871047 RepID=UPI0025C1143E|nr:hypothetical protein [Chryseobacterium sp.]MCJ7933941.1 hypothetical protein [Chryseobacterium sp.]
MKKIIISSLLMVSAIAFAKTETPNSKIDLPKKEEKVLMAKKNFKDENLNKKIEVKANINGMNSALCFAIAELVGSYDPIAGIAIAVGTCIPLAEAGF